MRTILCVTTSDLWFFFGLFSCAMPPHSANPGALGLLLAPPAGRCPPPPAPTDASRLPFSAFAAGGQEQQRSTCCVRPAPSWRREFVKGPGEEQAPEPERKRTRTRIAFHSRKPYRPALFLACPQGEQGTAHMPNDGLGWALVSFAFGHRDSRWTRRGRAQRRGMIV